MARLHDRPRPYQAHQEVAEHEARQQHIDHVAEAMRGFARPLRAIFLDQQRNETDDSIDQCQSAENPAADCKAGAKPDDQDGARRGGGIFLGEADQTQEQDHHRDRERRVLRVHEHVAVEGRAQRQHQQRREPGQRTADASRQPPRHGKADDADDGAEQAAGFEQFERNDLVQQRGRHVEAAAIHIEIGERQRAGILETAPVHPQQQVGIFGVGVVIPAQSVVTEGQARNQSDGGQHDYGKVVPGPLRRAPRRRIEGRSRDG